VTPGFRSVVSVALGPFGSVRPNALLATIAVLAVLSAGPSHAEQGGEPPKAQPPGNAVRTCRDCGVVRSIREVRTERTAPTQNVYASSPQYLESRPFAPPVVGPAFSLTWGAGQQPQTSVGAVGSPQMQQRLTEISYEIIVRFDDGRFGLFEQDDPADLRIGDKVVVVNKRVEKLKPVKGEASTDK